ncbi:MAG: reverse transcriptase domain-containing protein, partial [Cyanobacteria bacterium J06553_1]
MEKTEIDNQCTLDMNTQETRDKNWEKLGDKVAHNIMTRGLIFEFSTLPPLSADPPRNRKSHMSVVRKMVSDLIARGIVRQEPVNTRVFYSHLFVVPKKEGKFRLIIDLKKMNKHVVRKTKEYLKIKEVTRTIMQPGWACKIDLQDAYYQVPIAQGFTKYLAFPLDGKTFTFQFLPFGLTTAPWAFSRIITPIKGYFHKKGVNFHSYLDDFIIICPSLDLLKVQIKLVQETLSDLGLKINLEKSVLIPTRELEYLGIWVDCLHLRVSVTQKKKDLICRKIPEFLLKDRFSKRDLESLVGLMNFLAPCIHLGRMYLAPMQRFLSQIKTPNRDLLLFNPKELEAPLSVWLDQ